MRITDGNELRLALEDSTVRVIELAPGEFLGPFDINRPLTLRGAGSSTVVYHPAGPVFRMTVPGCKLEQLRVEITGNQGGILFEDVQPSLRDVELRAGGGGEEVPLLPSVIQLDAFPPDQPGTWSIQVETKVPLELAVQASILSVEPNCVQPGRHRLRLRLDATQPRRLSVGMVILSMLIVRSPNCRYEVPIRGVVDPSAQPSRAAIRVPEDVTSLEEAIRIAGVGEKIIVNSTFIQEELLQVGKQIELISNGEDGMKPILRNVSGPALVLSHGARIRGFHIENGEDSAIMCEGAGIEICDCTVGMSAGNGIHLSSSSSVLASGVEVRNCRGGGIDMAPHSELRLIQSHLYANRRSNLSAGLGTVLVAERSSFQRSRQGSGIITGGKADIIDCILFSNARSGIWIEEDGKVQVSKGQIEGNQDWGVCVSGSGQATLCGVKLSANKRGEWKADNPAQIHLTDNKP